MFSEKRAVSVLIVSASEKTSVTLSDILPRSQFSPIMTASSAGQAKRMLVSTPADIVIINTPLQDDYGIQLAMDIIQDTFKCVLMLVKSDSYEQVAYKTEEFGILTLPRPCSKSSLMQAVQLLTATRARLRALEEKASSLEAKMQDIRIINRAKLLLVEHLNMGEADAHRYIEKAAMDACVKRREIAENIIHTYDI